MRGYEKVGAVFHGKIIKKDVNFSNYQLKNGDKSVTIYGYTDTAAGAEDKNGTKRGTDMPARTLLRQREEWRACPAVKVNVTHAER